MEITGRSLADTPSPVMVISSMMGSPTPTVPDFGYQTVSAVILSAVVW